MTLKTSLSEPSKKTTAAQRAAVRKYQATLCEIKLRMKPEEKAAIAACAQSKGLSTRGYIMGLIRADMEGMHE
jgi:hypothetical protein